MNKRITFISTKCSSYNQQDILKSIEPFISYPKHMYKPCNSLSELFIKHDTATTMLLPLDLYNVNRLIPMVSKENIFECIYYPQINSILVKKFQNVQ